MNVSTSQNSFDIQKSLRVLNMNFVCKCVIIPEVKHFPFFFFFAERCLKLQNNWRVAISFGSLACSRRQLASASSLSNLSAVQSHKTHGWAERRTLSRYCKPSPPPEAWRCRDYLLPVEHQMCSTPKSVALSTVLNIYWLVNLLYV